MLRSNGQKIRHSFPDPKVMSPCVLFTECVCIPLCRCSCDSILATSEACVPLVTCPEAAPLIGALLQLPGTCVRAALSEHFLDAVSSAYSR